MLNSIQFNSPARQSTGFKGLRFDIPSMEKQSGYPASSYDKAALKNEFPDNCPFPELNQALDAKNLDAFVDFSTKNPRKCFELQVKLFEKPEEKGKKGKLVDTLTRTHGSCTDMLTDDITSEGLGLNGFAIIGYTRELLNNSGYIEPVKFPKESQ